MEEKEDKSMEKPIIATHTGGGGVTNLKGDNGFRLMS